MTSITSSHRTHLVLRDGSRAIRLDARQTCVTAQNLDGMRASGATPVTQESVLQRLAAGWQPYDGARRVDVGAVAELFESQRVLGVCA